MENLKVKQDECVKKYIRFGDLPEGLISKIHKGDGVYEQEVKGVSVWNCVKANGLEYPILPLNPNKDAIADYFNLLFSDRPIYIVTGTEIGIGHDGEPLLGSDIKILENVTEWYGYRHGRNKLYMNEELESTSKISEASGSLQVNDIVRLKSSDIVGVVKEIAHDEEGKLYYNVLLENTTSEYEFYVEDDLEKMENISKYFHNLLNN